MLYKVKKFIIFVLQSFWEGYKYLFCWQGRANRLQFWSFWILSAVGCITLNTLSFYLESFVISAVFNVFVYLTVFANISYTVRRFHDQNLRIYTLLLIWGLFLFFGSGYLTAYMQLLTMASSAEIPSVETISSLLTTAFLFFIGFMAVFAVYIFFLLRAGTKGANRYTAQPKATWISAFIMGVLICIIPFYTLLEQKEKTGYISLRALLIGEASPEIYLLNDETLAPVSQEELLDAIYKINLVD